jgi:hypothetical protein
MVNRVHNSKERLLAVYDDKSGTVKRLRARRSFRPTGDNFRPTTEDFVGLRQPLLATRLTPVGYGE